MILSAAGELPVTAITGTVSDGADSLLAQNILEETSNNIQTIGWYFNTRIGPIDLVPAASKITIADTILRIEFYNYNDLTGYTIRDDASVNRLYDLKNQTFTITTTISVKSIIDLVQWIDLPEAARQYIAKKASRIFVDRHVSDPNLARLTRQDEAEAMALLMREQTQTSNPRVFGPDMAWIVDRGKPLDWVTNA